MGEFVGESLYVHRVDGVGIPLAEQVNELLTAVLIAAIGHWLQGLIGVYEELLAKTGCSYRPPNCGKQGLFVQEGTQLILLSWACFFLPLPLASTFLWPPRSVHQEHFCLFHQMSGCRDMIETSVVITGPITDRGSHERLPFLRTLAVTAITTRVYLKCPLKESLFQVVSYFAVMTCEDTKNRKVPRKSPRCPLVFLPGCPQPECNP